ncbi:MAG: hypothetical protein HUJ55_06415 [Ileibacterium sp.]|nr:hypothetical protein [Ileibacterium sp.]
MDENLKNLLKLVLKFLAILLPIAAAIGFVVYELALIKSEDFMSFTSVIYIFFSILASLLFAYTAVKARNLVVESYRAAKLPKILEKSANTAKKDVKLGLYFAMVLNVVFALIQLYYAIINRSLWFICFFVLYMLLAAIRVILTIQINKKKLGTNLLLEYQWSRLVSLIIMIINSVFSAITFYVAHQNRGFEYPYLLTIYMIGYTIWLMVMALINLFKYRKYGSPILNALSWVNLVFALISILILETCLFYTFGQGAYSEIRTTVTGVSGAVIITIIWIISFSMFLDATFNIRSLRKQEKAAMKEWIEQQKETALIS